MAKIVHQMTLPERIYRPVLMDPLFDWKTPQVAQFLWRRWWAGCLLHLTHSSTTQFLANGQTWKSMCMFLMDDCKTSGTRQQQTADSDQTFEKASGPFTLRAEIYWIWSANLYCHVLGSLWYPEHFFFIRQCTSHGKVGTHQGAFGRLRPTEHQNQRRRGPSWTDDPPEWHIGVGVVGQDVDTTKRRMQFP